MSIRLTDEKKYFLKNLCLQLRLKPVLKIRDIATLLGKITSSFPGVKFGRLHYRGLQRLKTNALKANRYNFDAKTQLSEDAINDMRWWEDQVDQSFNDICIPNPSFTISTDASSFGWGASTGAQATGGPLTVEEKEEHINLKELKAILFGLKSLAMGIYNSHIKILCDNTTAVAAVNKFGTSTSFACNKLSQEIWAWAMERGNWLSCTHIAGKLNIQADLE